MSSGIAPATSPSITSRGSLEAGDSAYSAANYSTRIRSVGVWLDGYGELPLSNTPRVYLIPVGADVLRAAEATNFEVRMWDVVDQVLPIPFPIGGGDLSDISNRRPLDQRPIGDGGSLSTGNLNERSHGSVESGDIRDMRGEGAPKLGDRSLESEHLRDTSRKEGGSGDLGERNWQGYEEEQ